MASHATASANGCGARNDVRNGNGNGTTGIASKLYKYPKTGVSVLIVGSGIGGLTTALECWRKGHSVRILERSTGPVYTGDNLTIQPSALAVFRHWPKLCEEIEKDQYDCWISYYRHSGQHIYGPSPPSFNDPENIVGRKGPYVAFMQSRIKFYKSLVRQVAHLGMVVEYNRRVVEYYEDAALGVGGVVLESDERLEADIVVAADGISTHSGRIVSGIDIRPKESGMAVYRSAYPIENISSEPLVQERWKRMKGDRPIWEFWLGAGLHVLVVVTDDIVCWGLTHQDDGSATESWTPDVEPAEVLKVMEREAPGWHPAIAALMRTAPKGAVIHWKLMWRDLCKEWTSPAGHVVQVGDSAHSFLPTSGNGASQAIEDATTLATCLQLGGRSNASTATKVYNKLRYERVSCAQKMSFVNSQIKQHTDWAAVAENPKLIRTRFPRWIYQHDPEAYAYEKFGLAFNHVVTGGAVEFQNSNFPVNHVFKNWTIEEVQQEIKAGRSVEALLDGDWT